MSMFQDYQVTEDAVRQARALGMWGNIANRLKKMAQESAPFTHPDANRRFEGYIMKIDRGMVVSVQRFESSVSGDTGRVDSGAERRTSMTPADDRPQIRTKKLTPEQLSAALARHSFGKDGGRK